MSSSKLSSRQKPRGICTPYAFFLNICREKCSKKLSKEVDFNMLSAICWEKWNVMTEFQKRRFIQMSKYDELRYEKEMIDDRVQNCQQENLCTFYGDRRPSIDKSFNSFARWRVEKH